MVFIKSFFKGRPLLQGVPLPKTIHWIVFGIHPCGALCNCRALPHAPQGLSALDLTKGSILPLESHSWARRTYSAVSDVRLSFAIRVSEFTSDNVARQRGLRAERQHGKAARAPRRATTWQSSAGSTPSDNVARVQRHAAYFLFFL